MISNLFEQPSDWQICASGQAEGHIEAIAGPDGGRGLRMHYDFHGGGGFVVMRRPLALALPHTFELGFHLRGNGPPNHFECKVASPGGSNVWRHQRLDFPMPAEWEELIVHEREMRFAWGPAGGGAPGEIEAIEFVIAAGPGDSGFVDLALPHLFDQTMQQPAAIHASSAQPHHPADAAFADGGNAWRALAGDPDPWWSIDFGRNQRFGGLILTWPDHLPARAFTVETSADGQAWSILHEAQYALGRLSHIPAPGTEARHLRLRFARAECAAIESLGFQPDAFSQTPNEFLHAVARDFPRGWHPRYWHREQSYWTPVGSPVGKRRALINEEGMVEVDEAGFSLEPFLLTTDGLLTWAEMDPQPGLAADGLPMPEVAWRGKDVELQIQPWIEGAEDQLTLHVQYRVQRTRGGAGLRLAVAVRPFQVNPPWQAFRNLGGVSPIRHVDPAARLLRIDGRVVSSTPTPQHTGAARFEEGGVVAYLAQNLMPPHAVVTDESGRASAAMVWEIPDTADDFEVTLTVPYFHEAAASEGREAMEREWQRTLGKVEWQLPTSAREAIDCWRTCAGHILINRDGPAIQPGPRRYTRSWVRDCVIMGSALVRVGLPDPLRIFIDWYAAFQRDDGFVPCVVDRDGIDWLVEHDSHGQFLWGLREVMRAAPDDAFLARHLPGARKAAEYLVHLRAQRMTDAEREESRLNRYGLLPESASHEGYLAHPVHSYWDDFWGIRGLQACADLCERAGHPGEATRWRGEAEAFQHDVLRSLERVIRQKDLHYIPGSVEWADFDPTATANAIALLDFADVLPAQPLADMLATYLDGFRRKHRGEMPWNNYTAYEIRIIGAFLRLGHYDTAHELLAFFLSDRRPCVWNQWPEITWRDPRSPGHLGDVPHTWIAAEYIIAVTSMVASEREATDSLVLAAGLPWEWIAAESGFGVRHLPTRYGPLELHLHAADGTVSVTLADTLTLPAGGLFLQLPVPPGMGIGEMILTDGAAELVSPTSLRIHALPLRACISLRGGAVA